MATLKTRAANIALKFAGAVAALVATAPVYADAFATFLPLGGWGNNVGFFADPGDGGSFQSINPSNGEPAPFVVLFSYLEPSRRAGVNNVLATFRFNATTVNRPVLAGSVLVEENFAGSFSFTSQTALTIDNVEYAAGANLLSGVFSNAAIAGLKGGSSASLGATTAGGSTVTFTSSFLNFASSTTRDFSVSLSNISPAFDSAGLGSSRELTDFTASAGGLFSADGVVTAVPEPGEWAMIAAGLAVVGVTARRRSA